MEAVNLVAHAQPIYSPDLALNISVIIVNYNAGSMLEKCVTSILASEQKVEIIIVDNASVDNSLDDLLSSFPDESMLTIHHNKSNLGFAKACNIGTALATGRYLLYLNPDTILEKKTLLTMQASMARNQDAGMVGGMIVNADGSEQAGGRRSVPTPWRTFVRVFKLSKLSSRYPRLFSDFLLNQTPTPDEPVQVEAISGACMMVRRGALEDVGPMDEGYFMHCEDLDWCMRFRQKEWKILFVPSAKLTHHQGACSKSRPIFVEWHKHKGMMRFYRKFFRHQYPGLLMWLVGLGVWLRFGMVALLYGSKQIAARLGLRSG